MKRFTFSLLALAVCGFLATPANAASSFSVDGDGDDQGPCGCGFEEGTNDSICVEDTTCDDNNQCASTADCTGTDICLRGDNCCGFPICSPACPDGTNCTNPGTCDTGFEECVQPELPTVTQWGVTTMILMVLGAMAFAVVRMRKIHSEMF